MSLVVEPITRAVGVTYNFLDPASNSHLNGKLSPSQAMKTNDLPNESLQLVQRVDDIDRTKIMHKYPDSPGVKPPWLRLYTKQAFCTKLAQFFMVSPET